MGGGDGTVRGRCEEGTIPPPCESAITGARTIFATFAVAADVATLAAFESGALPDIMY